MGGIPVTFAAPMVCYCKKPIHDGGRRLELRVDWGADDLRAPWAGSYLFCSFACVRAWANDRSADHDGHAVVEGADEAHGNEEPADTEPPVTSAAKAVVL